MRLNAGHTHLETQGAHVHFHPAFELLAVLQGARRVKGELPLLMGFFRANALLQGGHQVGQQLAQVLGEVADAGGFVGIRRVVAKNVAIVFDGDTAARGVHHNRFHALRHMRPPGVDVVLHLHMGRVLVVQVEFHAAAATGQRFDHGLNATRIQHPRGGAVDVGAHAGLHTTGEHQYLACMGACGPRTGAASLGHFGFEGAWQQSPHALAQLHGRAKQGRGQAFFQGPAHTLLSRGAGDFFVHDFAANVDQMPILHAAGTGGFAVAAGEAPVQMQLRVTRGRHAFQHLFDEVDAPTRPIQLVTQ